MSDPTRFDMGDWLAAVVASTIAGMGGAAGWFRASNQKRDARITAIEESMKNYQEVRAAQATQLAVLQTCQANIQDRLEEIKEDIKNSAESGAVLVNKHMDDVLSEIRRMKR